MCERERETKRSRCIDLMMIDAIADDSVLLRIVQLFLFDCIQHISNTLLQSSNHEEYVISMQDTTIPSTILPSHASLLSWQRLPILNRHFSTNKSDQLTERALLENPTSHSSFSFLNAVKASSSAAIRSVVQDGDLNRYTEYRDIAIVCEAYREKPPTLPG